MKTIFKKSKKIILIAFGIGLTALAALYFTVYNSAAAKLARQVNEAPEIKNTYKLDKAALVLPAQDENSVEVKLGDNGAAEFVPNLEISKWEGEVKMKIKPKIETIAQNKANFLDTFFQTAQAKEPENQLIFENEKINYQTPKEDYRFYNIAPNQEHPEGAYEFEVILKEKPQSNIVSLDIETENLDFFYQPPLTQQEIDEGAFRPENVVGSYAVYHKTKRDHILGQKNYQTGKAFHIYRPKIIDVNNNWVWGEFNKDLQATQKLTITVPQEFLDTAVYPVIVDPTFGYTSLGVSGGTVIASNLLDQSSMAGNGFNLSQAGTLDSLHIALYTSAGNENSDIFVAIYREDSAGTDSHDLVASVEELDKAVNTTSQFYQINAASEALTADDYIIAGLGNGADIVGSNVSVRVPFDDTNNVNFYFEATTGGSSYATRKGENPWTETKATGQDKRSLYATYTAATSCGDGTCNGSETHTSCPADCRATVINKPQTNFMNDDSLVGYWSFDGSAMNWASTTAEALDLSGNNNNGNVTNFGKEGARIGKVGQALSFDGSNDYVDGGSGSSLGINGDHTVSAWIYPRSVNSGIIVQKDNDSNGWTYPYLVMLSSNYINYQRDDGSATRQIVSNSELSVNKWYHVAVRYSTTGTVMQIYLNGVLDSEGSTALSITSQAFPLGIGASPNNGNYFNGLIDEVRVYNRALSASEISDLYRAGAAKMQVSSPTTNYLTSGLVGNWTFNGQDMNWASTTAEALDRSGNNNNGNVTNFGKEGARIGKVGQALNFDKINDYVSASSASFDNMSSLTASLWLKAKSDGEADWGIFVSKGYATGDTGWFLQFSGYGAHGFRFWVDYNGASDLEKTAGPITLNQWHHIAVTWDGTSNASGVKIYIDGVEDTSGSSTNGAGGRVSDVGQNLFIGNDAISGATFDGLIDEVRVYNRALSASEIQDLYNLGLRKVKFKQ